MARTVSAAVLSELGAAKNEPFHMFEAAFDGGTVYLTDAPYQISWNGNTYLSAGHYLSFDGIEENAQLAEARVRVTLSGVDQVWISNVLGEQYIDRQLVIRRAFLAPGGNALVDPIPLFDGLMDAPSISEDHDPGGVTQPGESKCSVTIEAGSHWSDFGRRPGRHANDHEQRFFFPGDEFFEYVSEINRDITWGSA